MSASFSSATKVVKKKVTDKDPYDGTDVVKFANDEKKYSILCQPDANSALVLAQKKEFCDFDLETLNADLDVVGHFMLIAFTAAAAAPPTKEMTLIKVQIKELSISIADLCRKSSVTVTDFAATSKIILEEMECTYQFLIDGYEKMAIVSMASISTYAQKMAETASQLQKACEAERKKVMKAIKSCEFGKTHADKENADKGRLAGVLDEELKSLEEEEKKLEEDEKEAKELRKKYEKMEDEEISKIRTSAFEAVANLLTAPACMAVNCAAVATTGSAPITEGLGTMIFSGDKKDASKRAEMYKEKEELHFQREIKFHKERKAKIQKKIDVMSKIESCKEKQDYTIVANKCLHEVVNCLNDVTRVLARVTEFWENLQRYCERLAAGGIKPMIEKSLESYNKTERIDIWTERSFKVKAVRYYARWVAFHSLCVEHKIKINVTKETLYGYISANPTCEEANKEFSKLTRQHKKLLEDELKRKT